MSPLLFVYILILFNACNSSAHLKKECKCQYFAARDQGSTLDRPLIYRANVPLNWKRIDPPSEESIKDSKKANCLFKISDDLIISLHTFPFAGKQGINPSLIIERWKAQFEELSNFDSEITVRSQGGFHGWMLEASGWQNGKPIAMLGIAMHLSSLYHQMLTNESDANYKLADYTIKASGSPQSLSLYRQEILDFIKSFELIEELPCPF
jgi:hypothetical protein